MRSPRASLLAAAAEKSLDVQYYIWHGDQVGNLLFEALWQAAERGVRVRLLLDDMNTAGLDPTLAALDAHPNIEVRLYNPFVQREHPHAQFRDRLHAREPAHAQQVVHRRQPGERRRADATSATSTSAPAAASSSPTST